MTAGIISAKHRGIGITARENFLQTDAAINPGNSGGPLVTLDGEVIGINTAISSRSGGNDGIGFAVPINLAQWVANQLASGGTVRRAYLGVGIQPVTAELAGQFHVKPREGVVVTDVFPNTPAARAGLLSGDVIVAFGGHDITSPQELQVIVERAELGASQALSIVRDGQRRQLNFVPEEQPGDFGLAEANSGNGQSMPQASALGRMGLEIRTLDAAVAEQLGLQDVAGVVITAAKLILIAFLTVSVLICATAFYAIHQQFASFEQGREDKARELKQRIADNLAKAWQEGGRAGVEQALATRTIDLQHIQMRWVQFNVDTRHPDAPRAAPAALRNVIAGEIDSFVWRDSVGQEWLHTYLPVASSDGQPVGLELSESLAPLHRQESEVISSTLWTLFGMGLIYMLVVLTAGLRLVGRPLERLIAKTRQIGHGDYSQPVVVSGRDELSQLASALNEMSDQLRDHELSAANGNSVPSGHPQPVAAWRSSQNSRATGGRIST